jgi:hypothetical protein
MGDVYGKFEKKSCPSRRKRFIISSDRAEVDSWNPNATKEKSALVEAKTTRKEFSDINHEIFDTFIAFFDIVPLLTSIQSVYPSVLVKNELIPHFK